MEKLNDGFIWTGFPCGWVVQTNPVEMCFLKFKFSRDARKRRIKELQRRSNGKAILQLQALPDNLATEWLLTKATTKFTGS